MTDRTCESCIFDLTDSYPGLQQIKCLNIQHPIKTNKIKPIG